MSEKQHGRTPHLNLVIGLVIAVLVLALVVTESSQSLDALCQLRAGENLTYLDAPTGDLRTIYCEHPNGTTREISNLVNSTT